MRTNVDIDDKLMQDAIKVTGLHTKKEIVDLALRELLKKRKQIDPRTLLGIIQIDPKYDHRSLRKG